LLRELRDRFGKPRLSSEDALRMDSIRQGAAFQQVTEGGAAADEFLASVDAVIAFEFGSEDPRVLELVNKTNQFNLNGRRRAEAEWRRAAEAPESILAGIAYRDKFGPLGTIAVIQGRQDGELLRIDTWVMSCRAFSRRIEHQTLRTLFDLSGAREMEFSFAPTAKNGPTQEFFGTIAGARLTGPVRLTRAQFDEHCPRLYHKVEGTSKSWTQSPPA